MVGDDGDEGSGASGAGMSLLGHSCQCLAAGGWRGAEESHGQRDGGLIYEEAPPLP